MLEKKDKELRNFAEILDLTLETAENRATGMQRLGKRKTDTVDYVEIEKSCGRILAENIVSDRPLPPYDRVAVDGFACRREDLPGPLELLGSVAAGDDTTYRVERGSCVKVMTGGMLPEGADTVLMVEHCEVDGDEDPAETAPGTEEGAPATVRFPGTGSQGRSSNFSPKGEDVSEGGIVLRAGTVIGAKHIAVLASVGGHEVPVMPLPRVGLLSTGDEVVEPHETPEAHQIRNSNAPQTIVQLQELGIEPTYYGIVPDDAEALRNTLRRARDENDLILMSGGVSMGDFDLAPGAMAENGFKVQYDRVAVKPGRPTTFAVAASADLFGLPGNPVSCFVIMEILVKPYLYRLMGGEYRPRQSLGIMAETFSRRKTSREEWIPVTLDGEGGVHPLEYHGSGHFHAISAGDGMIKIESGEQSIEKGDRVVVRPF